MNQSNSDISQSERALYETLKEITTRWQSFADESMTEGKQQALVLAITCGIARSKIAYKLLNPTTGEWIIVRYEVSGTFSTLLTKYLQAECPADWYEPGKPKPRITSQPNSWELRLTDKGADLQQRPLNEAIEILVNQNSLYSEPQIWRMGNEYGRDSIASTPTTSKEYSDWKATKDILNHLGSNGVPMPSTTWQRHREKLGDEIQEHPTSGARKVRFTKFAADTLHINTSKMAFQVPEDSPKSRRQVRRK